MKIQGTGPMPEASAGPERIGIGVSVSFGRDGSLTPLEVLWKDGRRFAIDRITDVRQAAAFSAGGCGLRYTVWIRGEERYLFFRKSLCSDADGPGRWFIEKKRA